MKKLISVLAVIAVLLSCAVSASADAQPLSEEAAAWWNGHWYGWRVCSAAGGEFAERQGQRCDVVGTVETMDEHGVIVLWDYDTFAECSFLTAFGDFFYDESGLGRFYSSGGFAFEEGLDEKTLSARPLWELEHLLRLRGSYTDPGDAKNYYRYDVFLRPWGMDWEDVGKSALGELPFDDMLPQHYEDWYLEQLARGLDPFTEPQSGAND